MAGAPPEGQRLDRQSWRKEMGYLDNFHYQILGNAEKPRLVFLHGLMGAGINWRKITPKFEADYQILIYDQRGHGRSFQPESGYAPEDYADDLKQILDELGWQKINLVGHSLGGRNSFNFASRFPERLICLVVEDIGPEASDSAISNIERLIALVPVPFPSRSEAREFFNEEFPRRLLGHPKAKTLAQYFYTNMTEQPDGSVGWRFSEKGIRQSMRVGRAKERWQEVASLKVPTLWVRGADSNELSKEVFEKILRANPDIRGVEVADAAHWIHFDQPEEFARVIKEFIDEHQV